MSRQAAIACFVSGVAVTLFWLFFVHAKESIPLGLCAMMFSKPSLFPSLANVDPIIAALPVSSLVFLLVNARTPPVEADVTEKAFNGIIDA